MSKFLKEQRKYLKRTWKEAFGERNEEDDLTKKKIAKGPKDIEIIKRPLKYNPDNVITYDLENMYKDIVIDNNDNIIFKEENLNFELYENNFFDIIQIIGDGNCFFRTVSKYIYGNENNYSILRKATYNYVKDNLTEFYEFCYVEDGCYYTDIEEGGVIKKYVLDDYVEELKNDKVYSGYIEINAISKIINRVIILLETLSYNDSYYYKKLSYFNHNKWVNPVIEDIIFINYDKDIHYQLLKPNKKFIIERINNKEENYNKIIYYDRVKKIIIDPSKNLNYNLSSRNIKLENKNNNEKKSNEKMFSKTNDDINDSEIKSEDEEKSESINSENNSIVTTENIKENDDKDKKCKNNDTDKVIEKEMKLDKNNYDMILKSKNNINKYIKNDKNQFIKKIPNYPILIGNKIDLDYYSDIYRYLYINKNKFDISSYPETIKKIKKKNQGIIKKEILEKKLKNII